MSTHHATTQVNICQLHLHNLTIHLPHHHTAHHHIAHTTQHSTAQHSTPHTTLTHAHHEVLNEAVLCVVELEAKVAEVSVPESSELVHFVSV